MKSLKVKDALECLQAIKLALQSGRSWREAVGVLREISPNSQALVWFENLTKKVQLDGAQTYLSQLSRESKGLERNLYEFLLEIERGSPDAIAATRRIEKTLKTMAKLRDEEKSLLFVPRLQAVIIGALSLSLCLVLPLFFPEAFPSYLSRKQFGDFAWGLFLILLGLYLIFILSQWPLRSLRWKKEYSEIFAEVYRRFQSEHDFQRAWLRALDRSVLGERYWNLRGRDLRQPEGFMEAFREFSQSQKKEFQTSLFGIYLRAKSGLELEDFLRETADESFQSLLQKWRTRAQSIQFLSLLPTAFLIMPGSLYLLFGPQMEMFMKEWSQTP